MRTDTPEGRLRRLLHVGLWLVTAFAIASCSETAKIPRIGEIGDAADFTPETFKGKVLVLNFWATWCGPCRIEIPDLIKLRQSFRPEDVAIVGIALSERGTPKQIDTNLKLFVAKYGVNYPIYYDEKMAWLLDYDPSPMATIPMTFVFDQNGNLQSKHRGVPRSTSGRYVPFEVLGEEIQDLLDSG